MNIKNRFKPYVFFRLCQKTTPRHDENFGEQGGRGPLCRILKSDLRPLSRLFSRRLNECESVGLTVLIFQGQERSYKKNVAGFSAIELVMVMAISAMMMTMLFQVYNQITKNMARVDRFVIEDTQIIALKNRFGRDVAGLSGIWYPHKKEKLQNGANKAEDDIILCRYFYSMNKNGHLETLSFLTTNPVGLFGFAQDRFVRVVYQVQPDPKHENLFRLMRQEILQPSQFLDEKTLNQGKFYEIAGAIKSIDFFYQLVDMIESNRKYEELKSNKDQTEKKEKPKAILRNVKEWSQPEKEEKAAKKDEQPEQEEQDITGAGAPQYIKMKIVFGKTDRQVEKSYVLDFPVPCIVNNIPKNIAKVGVASSDPNAKKASDQQQEAQAKISQEKAIDKNTQGSS